MLLLLLLLSYHRRLMMISDALELRVEGERVSNIGECVQLVMAMVGWVGAGIEVGDGMHA